jgi:serine protease Do
MTTTSIADGLASVADSLRRVTVRVHDGRRGGSGSGVVWSDGLIVTNAHVARGRHATIVDAGGASARATVERRDPERDLAALRVERDQAVPLDVRVARVRDSDAVRPGELAIAVGNPFGLVGALTAGLVTRRNARWVMADVRLAPGNSGGPLADSAGRVFGINSMVAGGLALAVPSNVVAAFVAGDRKRRTLGIAVTPTGIGRNGRRALALLVTDVLAGSRAERAGLILGDAIVAADAGALDARDAARQLAAASALEIVRAGERRILTLDGSSDGAVHAA